MIRNRSIFSPFSQLLFTPECQGELAVGSSGNPKIMPCGRWLGARAGSLLSLILNPLPHSPSHLALALAVHQEAIFFLFLLRELLVFLFVQETV
jgi:hypothetical protein